MSNKTSIFFFFFLNYLVPFLSDAIGLIQSKLCVCIIYVYLCACIIYRKERRYLQMVFRKTCYCSLINALAF